MSETQSPLNEDSEELKQALAAFGEGALDLFFDDDHDTDDVPPAFGGETKNTEEPGFAKPEIREFQTCRIGDGDSELIRYTKELVNAIYGGCSMPFDENGDQVATTSNATNRYIAFIVGQQAFGIPLSDAREITRCSKIAELPWTPSWLRGVTNVRGQIISVIDLRNLTGLPGDSPEIREKTIVVQSNKKQTTTAIAVDRILGIRSLNKQQHDLSGMDPRLASIASSVAKINDQEIVLIDTDKLLDSADLNANQSKQTLFDLRVTDVN